MKGRQGLRRFRVEFSEGLKLIGQNLENQFRIQFRIIHMPGLKPPVPVMFDEMMIGVSREGERVQPERVNRRFHQLREARPHRRKMRQIMLQEVMADRMRETGNSILQPIKTFLDLPVIGNHHARAVRAHSSKSKDPRRFRVHLQINGKTLLQKGAVTISNPGCDARFIH